MRGTDVPTKVPRGRNEVANRQLRQAATARAADCDSREQTLGEMRQQFRVPGDVDTIVGDLVGAGLIVADRNSLPDNVMVAEPMADSVPGATAVEPGGVRNDRRSVVHE